MIIVPDRTESTPDQRGEFLGLERPTVSAAREVIAIIDHTRSGRSSPVTFCRTDQLTAVLTDAATDARSAIGR